MISRSSILAAISLQHRFIKGLGFPKKRLKGCQNFTPRTVPSLELMVTLFSIQLFEGTSTLVWTNHNTEREFEHGSSLPLRRARLTLEKQSKWTHRLHLSHWNGLCMRMSSLQCEMCTHTAEKKSEETLECMHVAQRAE